jgi:hypothetical protein
MPLFPEASMELAGLEPATSWVRSGFGAVGPVHGSSSLFKNFLFSRDFRLD